MPDSAALAQALASDSSESPPHPNSFSHVQLFPNPFGRTASELAVATRNQSFRACYTLGRGRRSLGNADAPTSCAGRRRGLASRAEAEAKAEAWAQAGAED